MEQVWPNEPFRDPESHADSPWWLINFYLQLPFYLPYLDGATFNVTMSREEYADSPPSQLAGHSPFVLMKVLQRATPPDMVGLGVINRIHAELKSQGRLDPELQSPLFDFTRSPMPLHFTTVVEAITPKLQLRSERDRDMPLHPGVLLDRCLTALNQWMESYSVATGNRRVHPITKEQLPPDIMLMHQQPETGQIMRVDFMRGHANLPWSNNEIATPATTDRIMRIASNLEDHHTVWNAARWLAAAERLVLVDGYYEMSLVALHTAGELFASGVALVLLVDEGKSAAEIDGLLPVRMGLLKVCNTFLQPRLKGNWDRTSRSHPFGRFWQEVVLERNVVVHRGARLTPERLRAALVAMREFIEFVTYRVDRIRNRYPRTMMELITAFGKPESVVIGKAFDRRAQLIVASTPKYWLANDDPRSQEPPTLHPTVTPGNVPQTTQAEKAEAWASAPPGAPFRLVRGRTGSVDEPKSAGEHVE